MNHTVIPAGYEPTLSLYETQAAISLIKRTFQDHLAQTLNLKRVSAPLFVDPASGLNDVRSPSIFPRRAWRRRWCIRWPNGSAWPSIATIFIPARGSTPT